MNSRFTVSLAREIDRCTSGGFVFSPTSIIYMLGMIAEGADDKTQEEICQTLGFDGGRQQLNAFCHSLMVLSSESARPGECLEIANAVLIDPAYTLKSMYKRTIEAYYDADLFGIDLDNAGSFINKWVSEHTHGKISGIPFDGGGLWASFINALYFKASWAMPFDSYYTKSKSFSPDGSSTRKVQMMSMKDGNKRINFFESDDYKMIQLPYGDQINGVGHYVFSAILPTQNDLGLFLMTLPDDFWESATSSLKGELVDVQIPRFNIKSGINLNSVLYNLGISSLFTTVSFSRISDDSLSDLGAIMHIVNMSLDEKGTEAAAITYNDEAIDNLDSDQLQFHVFHANHPFLFVISEKTTGAILFCGAYK